ncbi:hypothetical protein [Roseivirga sp.]|uniref:hypothetical protein n=1 Tax=Roseivirga sp. TaxID=1964215 RepID=UPI003B51B949
MSKLKDPFLLRLTGGRIHPLLAGILASAVVFAIQSVIFLIEDIPFSWHNSTLTSYFTLTVGYLVFITRIIQSSHDKGFHKLWGQTTLSDSEKGEFERYFLQRGMSPYETVLSLGIGLTHAYFAVFRVLLTEDIQFPIFIFYRGLQIALLWWLIWQVASTAIKNMTRLNELSRKVDIDLLNMDKLMPLTSSGIVSVLAFIGTYSLLFIEGVDISDLTNPAIIVLIPSILWMIITPLKGVRKRVVQAKEEEIRLVDMAIEGDREALKSSRIGKNTDNINVVDLISYKKMIQTTFEIPINIPTASRFVFYLIIPFLTWVAASVVDKAIDYLIG